jgi:hypothetical protein
MSVLRAFRVPAHKAAATVLKVYRQAVRCAETEIEVSTPNIVPMAPYVHGGPMGSPSRPSRSAAPLLLTKPCGRRQDGERRRGRREARARLSDRVRGIHDA